VREKRKADPEWHARERATINAWRRGPGNLEKRRRNDRERYASDLEYRKKRRIQNRQYRTPEQDRHRKLKMNYGITAREYDALLASQGGGCAICGRDKNPGKFRQSLPVDHDHETGKIRGILCIDCNRALGMFRDDPRLLRKAAKYVESATINRRVAATAGRDGGGYGDP
jgi:hypothetical protein